MAATDSSTCKAPLSTGTAQEPKWGPCGEPTSLDSVYCFKHAELIRTRNLVTKWMPVLAKCPSIPQNDAGPFAEMLENQYLKFKECVGDSPAAFATLVMPTLKESYEKLLASREERKAGKRMSTPKLRKLNPIEWRHNMKRFVRQDFGGYKGGGKAFFLSKLDQAKSYTAEEMAVFAAEACEHQVKGVSKRLAPTLDVLEEFVSSQAAQDAWKEWNSK